MLNRETSPADEPRLIERFQAHETDVRVANYRTCGLWAMLFMMAGCSLDWVVYGWQGMMGFLPLRIGSVGVLAALNVVLRTEWGARRHRVLGLLMGAPLVVVIAIMIERTEGAASPYYAGLNLVLLGAAVMMRWPVVDSILVVIMTIGAYLLACELHGPVLNQRIFYNNLYFLGVTGVFTVVGTWIYNRIRYSEFRSRDALDRSREELEQANARLETNNRRLLELDEAKSRFFANISHELRTPLTLLIAPLDVLLARTAKEAHERDMLLTMRANTMRLVKLINDLLELVKLESGTIKVTRLPLNLATFIREQVAAVRVMAEERGLNVLAQVESNANTVQMDEEKLERICLNLLFNAIKHTPAGGSVKLSAEVAGDALILKVADTGDGILPADLPHLFDRFWQSQPEHGNKPRGLGIGLSLVKELAEAHGGAVSVESTLGAGTTFTVSLPLVQPLSQKTENKPETHSGSTDPSQQQWLAELYRDADRHPVQLPVRIETHSLPAPQSAASLSTRPLLLIAEDEPEMMRFLAEHLDGEFEVLKACNGAQAVSQALQHLPDIILTDLMMPDKDGYQVCCELQQHESTKKIPVVLLTAKADEETKLRLLEAGATDFLAKPFSLAEVGARLKNLAAMRIHAKTLAAQKQQIATNLAQLKEAESLLVRNEKLAALGRLSAGLIHEINNPLNYAKQALYVIRRMIRPLEEDKRAEILEVVGDVENGIDRVVTITSDLRGFATRSPEKRQYFLLRAAVETTLRFFAPVVNSDVAVELHISPDLEAQGDRNQFLQVLINLIQNALDAVASKKYPPGEKPLITLHATEHDASVRIRIRDNGSGISPEVMSHIFDPFFTTKDVGQGMGLGLSICHRIIAEHHGQIEVQSEPGHYTEIQIDLPAPTSHPSLAA
jgi:signal transduction histidine kinase